MRFLIKGKVFFKLKIFVLYSIINLFPYSKKKKKKEFESPYQNTVLSEWVKGEWKTRVKQRPKSHLKVIQTIAYSLPSRITSRLSQALSRSQPPKKKKSPLQVHRAQEIKRQKQMLKREYHFRILWIERNFSHLGKTQLCGGQWGCEMSSALEPTAPAETRSSVAGTNINHLTPGTGSRGADEWVCRRRGRGLPLASEDRRASTETWRQPREQIHRTLVRYHIEIPRTLH